MDHVEEIKKKIDMVDLVSSYLTLKKAGKNYKACCPFHNEKTPSFMVSPEKQIWYCFGCSQGGDVFNFVEKIENTDFVGALNILADKAGVIIDKKNFVNKSEKDRYYEIMDLAARFYAFILKEHGVGKKALEYLTDKRGLDKKTIDFFLLGFAPDDNALLISYFKKKNYQMSDLEKVGLVTKNQRGIMVDKFRDRIMFPIRGQNGKVIAFGGRIFNENKYKNFSPPKYLNSPQTLLYDKSSTIYGLCEAKEAIKENDLAIMVEGYLDVISSSQSGVKNVVATSGTALNQNQVDILSRYTKNIAFCFDNDLAGQNAMFRSLDIARGDDINIKAIVINEAKDPDELIKKDKELWKKAATSPVDLIELLYELILKKYANGSSPEDKKKITQEFLPIIKRIRNEIDRSFWIKRISNDLTVHERYIFDALDKVNIGLAKNISRDKPEAQKTISLPKELLLMNLLMHYPKNLELFFEKIKEEDLKDNSGKSIYKFLGECHNSKDLKEKISPDYILNNFKISREEKTKLELSFFLVSNFIEDMTEKEIEEDIEFLISSLVQERKERRKKEIEFEISRLNKEKNTEEIKKLLRELQSLI